MTLPVHGSTGVPGWMRRASILLNERPGGPGKFWRFCRRRVPLLYFSLLVWYGKYFDNLLFLIYLCGDSTSILPNIGQRASTEVVECLSGSSWAAKQFNTNVKCGQLRDSATTYSDKHKLRTHVASLPNRYIVLN